MNLRGVVELTGAVIVISSSWRHMGLSQIQGIWREWHFPGKVIGCTPGDWGDEETFDTRSWSRDSAVVGEECSRAISICSN